MFDKRLEQLQDYAPSLGFGQLKRGVEKENLRVSALGRLSAHPHPDALGSSLTNSCITTDFSESLIEIITEPSTQLVETIGRLKAITAFVNESLSKEWLWPYSMPCHIDKEDDIIIANYGSSNVAKMKTLYRRGLSYRYGKIMQMIAGIHYNISLPDKFLLALKEMDQDSQSTKNHISSVYLRLIRQFCRFYWLLPYLFGASPVCMKSSLIHPVDFTLLPLNSESVYGPFATSLRLSRLGYHNNYEDQLHISYENIQGYAMSLLNATRQRVSDYTKIGVVKDGHYRQLNDAILQIENEYYSPIRPKRIGLFGERPATALLSQGVEYIELRALDLNPFLPTGIGVDDMVFLDVFLTFCAIMPEEKPKRVGKASIINLERVAVKGRDPKLRLLIDEKEVSFTVATAELFEKLSAVACLMDSSVQDQCYSEAVELQLKKVKEPELTPSAKFMNSLQQSGATTTEFIMQLAREHQEALNSQYLSSHEKKAFEAQARESFFSQSLLEDSDDISFEQYLYNYFSQ